MSSARMFSKLVPILFVLPVLTQAPEARGEAKPVLVVTAAPVQTILAKTQYLTAAAGFKEAGVMLGSMIESYANGLDPQRPVIGMVQVDEQNYDVFVLVPTTDVERWLQATPFGAAFQKTGEGLYQGAVRGMPVTLKSANGWACFSQSPESLQRLPADIPQLTGGMEGQFDLSIRAMPGNLPEAVRNQLLQQARQMAQFSLQQQSQNGTEEELQIQQQQVENMMKGIERLATEVEYVGFGFLADEPSKRVLLNGQFQPLEETASSRQVGILRNVETRLSSFAIPKAMVSFTSAMQMLPEQIADQKVQMDTALRSMKLALVKEGSINEAAKKEAEAAIDAINAIWAKSVESGRFDLAGSLIVVDGMLQGVMGGRVAAPSEVDGLLTRLESLGKELGTEVVVKRNFGKAGDTTLHGIRVALPTESDLQRAFGKNLTLFLGVSDQFVFIGLGDKSLTALKKSIAAAESGSPTRGEPMRVHISGRGVADFVAQLADGPETDAILEQFKRVGDNEKVIVTQWVTPEGGLTTQIEVQEGVISAIGATAANRGQ